jgi:SAM-dependent methyltransferase
MPTLAHDYAAFNPRAYLREYYDPLPPESIAHVRWLVDTFRHLRARGVVLDFGSGPTLYTAIVAAAHQHTIHLSDYLAANRAEIHAWLNDDPNAFDWRATIGTTLELEGHAATPDAIARRAAAVRHQVTQVLHGDAHATVPVAGARARYDVVVTNLCLEAAARTFRQWQQCVQHVASLVKPGGHMLLTAVQQATTYAVGDLVFPVVSLTEHDITQTLGDAGFVPASMQVAWIAADHPVHPYNGCVCVVAAKATTDGHAVGA